jgi:hypothetical protein
VHVELHDLVARDLAVFFTVTFTVAPPAGPICPGVTSRPPYSNVV